MFKNYLIVSFRNLVRNFSYSLVNIFGLTVGLACTLVIGTWVYQEYTYDRQFKDAENIYRVGVNFFNIGDMAIGTDALPTKLADYSEIEAITAVKSLGQRTLQIGDQSINLESGYEIDQFFFSIFNYDFEQGSAISTVSAPNSVVLSAKKAIELFGTSDAIGETFKIKGDAETYQVTGILSPSRFKTHLESEFWLYKEPQQASANWTSAGKYVYVKVAGTQPDVTLDEILDQQIAEISKTFSPDMDLEAFKESGTYKLLPMPISDIHLRSKLKFEPSTSGNVVTTNAFAGIAILILTLASINFINITTARATTRAKEVGIRKSLGTNKSQLIQQFIIESQIVCLTAMTGALIIGEYFLKGFESVTGLELLSTLFLGPLQLIIVYAGAIVIGTLAGFYPALYMTRFYPAKVLKGLVDNKEKGWLRNGLVLFQFTISISLLIVALFVFQQISYMEGRDLGFRSENVLIIENMNKIPSKQRQFQESLQNLSYVQSTSLNQRLPASNSVSITQINGEEDTEVWMHTFAGDENMITCLGYQLLEGRNFSSSMATDTAAVILNQSAVTELGLEEPVGKFINEGKLQVIGVVSDFNFESLKESISPAMLVYQTKDMYNLSVKFSGSPAPLLAEITAQWDTFNSDAVLDYHFLDDNFEQLVKKEKVLSKGIITFTLLAMFISCLGLYGLSIFTAQKRTKEIGIRRVLGASMSQITVILSKGFAKPILISFVLSIPVAYLIASKWLAAYAYRIEIGPVPFAVAGAVAILLGLATISWQALRTALKNPVVSLRSE